MKHSARPWEGGRYNDDDDDDDDDDVDGDDGYFMGEGLTMHEILF